MDLHLPNLDRLIDQWLEEDIGRGDLTRCALNKGDGEAHWIAKEPGVFCGGDLVKKIFKRFDQTVQIDLLIRDGEKFADNERLIELKGPKAALVGCERTALNLAMHLSGISTTTAALVAELQDTKIRLADTRKTTPGLRVLEKYAVRCGGGVNHRFGLDDSAMLKENHLAWTESIEHAVKAIRKNSPWSSKIIIEAENPEQAEEAVIAGADGVLLDEMSPEMIQQLIPKLRDLASKKSHKVILEASGVNTIDLKKYAETGVDIISTSAPVTRSTWINFSMRFNKII